MGESFLRKRAPRFRHQHDAALQQELAQVNLFSSRPDVFHTDYECGLLPGSNIEEGDPVFIRQTPGGNVDVVRLNQVVGKPCDPALLSAILSSDCRHGGLVPARVQTRSQVSDYFYLRITNLSAGDIMG